MKGLHYYIMLSQVKIHALCYMEGRVIDQCPYLDFYLNLQFLFEFTKGAQIDDKDTNSSNNYSMEIAEYV